VAAAGAYIKAACPNVAPDAMLQSAPEVFGMMKSNARAVTVIHATLVCGLALTACSVAVNSDESKEQAIVEKQYFNLPHLDKPSGYTHVVTSPPGKLIFLSGQGGAGQDGKLPDDFATQTENTFKNIEKCLALAGATFDDVVKMGYFLTDIEKLAEVRAIRSKYINMENPPASTLVQAPLIGNLLIEIDVVAVVPEQR
jgi:enamine deaminase RidA (YjgF/YER057c/UK114 family)